MKSFNFGRLSALFLSSVLMGTSSFAGDYIIKFKSGHAPQELKTVFGQDATINSAPIIDEMNLHVVKVRTHDDPAFEMQRAQKTSFVEYVQFNHKLKLRSLPNDPMLSKQWSLGTSALANINAPQAWSVTTGGKDKLGNDLVVAIIDGGFDIHHADLVENAWVNKGEIPNNSIDDDGNGYIDDVYGWNGSTGDSEIGVEDHGSLVAGIIGAKGNNGSGVTGINWNTKMMYVGMTDADTASAVAAYGYVLKQKQLWIKSNGKQGANIVVSNSSFGIDRADCSSEEFPVWNDMFEKMGAVGILSAAAVPNDDIDTDADGDVPSGCPSQYIIAVTNHAPDGKLASMENPYTHSMQIIAGHGVKNVDVAAPGMDIFGTVPFACSDEDVYCMKPDSSIKYAKMSGTSFSTPHVAGGIALMYSAASSTLINEYYKNPKATALVFKNLLLQSTDKTSDFSQLVSSGGRLNLYKAVQAAQAY